MIRAYKKTPSGLLTIIGLSDENIARLKNGQPIRASLESFGINLPGALGIMYGTTEREIEQQFRDNGMISLETEMRFDPRVDDLNAIKGKHSKILVCTVGLPRSGKSTWARAQAYPIVNPDSIRLAIHGQQFIASAEPFVWATAKAMVKALFLAGHKTVILDACNVSRKRRDEWWSDEWATFFKEFDTSVDECHKRDEALGGNIGPIIARMAEQREPLGDDEILWP